MHIIILSTKVVYLQRYLIITLLVPHETAAVSPQVLCTPYIHAPVYSVTFFQSDLHRVHVCLTVTCHLHFWQDRPFTWWCSNMGVENRNRYKSRHRKLTMPGLEPVTFQSQAQHSITQLSPLNGKKCRLRSSELKKPIHPVLIGNWPHATPHMEFWLKCNCKS